MDANDLNDGAILQATVVTRDGYGKHIYSVQLPDGHTLTSAPMTPEQANRAVVDWCQKVRDFWAGRLEDKKAEAARKRAALTHAAATTKSESARVSASSVSEPATAAIPPESAVSPEDLVRNECRKAAIRMAKARNNLIAAQHEMRSAEASLAKWETVANSLNIDLGESDESDDGAEQGDQQDSGSGAGGDGSDLRPVGGDDSGPRGSGSEDSDAGAEQGDDQHDESGDDVGGADLE